jgi:glycolate oxidase iron-sulfur subunit
MSDIKTLANLIKSLENQLTICVRCGICQSVCPVFRETRKEMDVARGKLSLLSCISEEMFENSKHVKKYIDKCLLCGSCAARCPNGVNAIEIFIKSRLILSEYEKLSKIKKLIIKGMLSNPKRFDRLINLTEKLQKFFVKESDENLQTFCIKNSVDLTADFLTNFLRGRNFRILAKEPFHQDVKFINTKGSKIKAAFFTGCLIDKFFPNIAKASIHVLNHHNIGIYLPKNQGCCGMPAISYGDLKTLQKLILYHITLFQKEKFDYLITSCATCTFVIKKIWHIFAENDELKEKALILSKKTMDINEFLVKKTDFKKFKDNKTYKNNKKITYHDPCHLKKSLNIFEEPREILKQSGYDFVEMKDADVCCGMGGSFNITHYDISKNIGKLKKENIEKTGCDIVATSCPACMMQLFDMISFSKKKILIKHPIEIYADYLKTALGYL